MPKRWAWLGAILLVWASLAAGASDVKVQGLAPNQCEGNLTITITGSSADDFVGAGDRATVELVKSKGPEGVIEGFSTVPYTRSQNVVTLEIHARRDPSAALDYKLRIGTVAAGLHPVLTDLQTIGPGGPSCLPPLKPVVSSLSVDPIAGDVYSVRFHLKADRKANLRVLVEDVPAGPRFYDNVFPVD